MLILHLLLEVRVYYHIPFGCPARIWVPKPVFFFTRPYPVYLHILPASELPALHHMRYDNKNAPYPIYQPADFLGSFRFCELHDFQHFYIRQPGHFPAVLSDLAENHAAGPFHGHCRWAVWLTSSLVCRPALCHACVDF